MGRGGANGHAANDPAILGRVFELAPDATLFVDAGGRIIEANTKAEEMFGYGRGELIGQRVEVLIPERFASGHVRHREGYMAGPRTRPMGAGVEISGYSVLEASNGAEALRICQEHRGTIHLMLTDVVMPEMAGRPLAEHLAQVRPETRVLYMSGYTDDAVVRHGVLRERTAFLQKPFTPHVLSDKVREVLDRRHEG